VTLKKKRLKKKSRLLSHFKHYLLGVIIIFLILILALTVATVIGRLRTEHRQNALQPFYNTTGLSTTGQLGQVLRSEPLGVSLSNGTAERIIYRTQKGDGSITFSSAMVFIPNNSNAGTPRPVVAWAHGTVGMGDQCAPSRTQQPLNAISWVDEMLARGWVVTATDYAGLGTPGTENYLVGADEAHDVLNSVRAARDIPAAQASSTFAIWGHSQGGNSALFSASDATSYAPELHLVGTVASAPAAELPALFNETTGTLDWVIGPEVAVSWPTVYPNLNVQQITTAAGYNNYKKIANQCISAAALGGLVRTSLNQEFFRTSPLNSPGWLTAAQEQSAPILKPSQPVMIAESLQDKVVLPNTTALYIQRSCQADADLTSLWLADVGHVQLSNTIGPQVINWISDRFANQPTAPSCNQQLPITPATDPSTS